MHALALVNLHSKFEIHSFFHSFIYDKIRSDAITEKTASGALYNNVKNQTTNKSYNGIGMSLKVA